VRNIPSSKVFLLCYPYIYSIEDHPIEVNNLDYDGGTDFWVHIRLQEAYVS